ncbi:hypothetical protein UJ101_00643 [Flavobacteriaceae bacterium UJ101]|nr:hypothetical protein UJ101_00643 [Flavobacteriaceae bacterium UJ101]
MKTITNIVLVILFIISQNSCAQSSIKGEGSVITKEFPISNFTELNIAGSIDYILVDNARQSAVIVKTHANLMDRIEIKQKSSALSIGLKNNTNLRSYKTFEVYIPVSTRNLAEIHHAGSGEMISEVILSANSLELNHAGSGEVSTQVNSYNLKASTAGSGEINLEGKAENVKMSLSGSGEILAKNLKSKNAKIGISGSGEVEISVSHDLKVAISGSGDVYYKGNPSNIKKTISGSGDVTQL